MEYLISIGTDISERIAHEKQLEKIALYDALTNLPNRVLLAQRLQQALVSAKNQNQLLAVTYLDLDGFKAINDNYGHEVGDELLKLISARMQKTLRSEDTLSRIGGDEFVAILVNINNQTETLPFINALLKAAAEPIYINQLKLQVSASLGLTFYPQVEEVDADQLLRQADQAMYQAKLAGKNRFHIFDTEHDRSVRGHHASIDNIRHAMLENQFILYYQPKVNMRTGQVVGTEALIRWQHPTQGLLPPADFLPIIENHALAIELGEWVLKTALNQLDYWHEIGLHLPISINVSANHLQQSYFVERLRTILNEHPNLPPESLELEVLETSALEDINLVSQIIEDCHTLNVSFALDDFGTGYSSLTYLRRLPVNLLKIDQSFVRDMLEDPEDLAILEGIIGLASAFRRDVIAEGVESLEHCALLLRLDCELAQGYGIARPMPADEIPHWVSQWKPEPSWSTIPKAHHDDIPLIFAAIEHRAWVLNIEAYIQGKVTSLSNLDMSPKECRFGAWLDHKRGSRYGTSAHFSSIVLRHQQAHKLGQEVLDFWHANKQTEAMEKLKQLKSTRDQLVDSLKNLLNEQA